jgi:hypothetical protein
VEELISERRWQEAKDALHQLTKIRPEDCSLDRMRAFIETSLEDNMASEELRDAALSESTPSATQPMVSVVDNPSSTATESQAK